MLVTILWGEAWKVQASFHRKLFRIESAMAKKSAIYSDILTISRSLSTPMFTTIPDNPTSPNLNTRFHSFHAALS